MVKNGYELKLIRKSGQIAAAALKKALLAVKPGVTELKIDQIAKDEIFKLGGDLSYKTVPGYDFATCITVNEQVVHGIPTERQFKEGDLVSIDLAVQYRGWHTDCAWTILLGKDPEKQKFLQAGEKALWKAIDQAVEGARIGDISATIQSEVEAAGYSVVRSLVGHGVGKSLHQDPEIPGVGIAGTGPFIKNGMSLAIEVIYTKGSYELLLEKDGWTYSTADKSWGGLFEMSVIAGKGKAEVLTYNL